MKISNLSSHLDQPPDKEVPDCDDGDSLSNFALQVVLTLSLPVEVTDNEGQKHT
jgi:hypothetical protein